MELEKVLNQLDELKTEIDRLKAIEQEYKSKVAEEIKTRFNYTLGTKREQLNGYTLKLVQRYNYTFDDDFKLDDYHKFLSELESFASDDVDYKDLIKVKFQLNKKVFDRLPTNIRTYMESNFLILTVNDSYSWEQDNKEQQ